MLMAEGGICRVVPVPRSRRRARARGRPRRKTNRQRGPSAAWRRSTIPAYRLHRDCDRDGTVTRVRADVTDSTQPETRGDRPCTEHTSRARQGAGGRRSAVAAGGVTRRRRVWTAAGGRARGGPVAESAADPPGPIPNPVVTRRSAGEYWGGDPPGGEAAAGPPGAGPPAAVRDVLRRAAGWSSGSSLGS